MHILLVEDDENLGILLQDHLEDNKFTVTKYTNGRDAYQNYQHQFDLCILDIMMPEMDGFTLAHHIRESDEKTPIIFLTAKSLKDDKIEAFKIGADDYLTKPFSMDELLLRIEAILRRTNKLKKTEESYTIASFTFDSVRQKLKRGLNEQKLTSKESALLHVLCEHLNRVCPRDMVLKRVWGDDSYYNARSMDVYLSKLRKYLKEDEQIELLNVHGKGYKLIVKNYS